MKSVRGDRDPVERTFLRQH